MAEQTDEEITSELLAASALAYMQEGLVRVPALRLALAAASPLIRTQIAGQIRTELVCCDVYETRRPDQAGSHTICYWGEAAARIAEGRVDSV